MQKHTGTLIQTSEHFGTCHTHTVPFIPYSLHIILAAVQTELDLAVLCWVEIWHTCTFTLCVLFLCYSSCHESSFTEPLCIYYSRVLHECYSFTARKQVLMCFEGCWYPENYLSPPELFNKTLEGKTKKCDLCPLRFEEFFLFNSFIIMSLIHYVLIYEEAICYSGVSQSCVFHLFARSVCIIIRAVARAPEWKQNRCQLVQAMCVTEGPWRDTLDVRHDAPLLFSDIG